MGERITIYQTLPRLYGNRCERPVPNGSLTDNGSGKLNDFTARELARIHDFGFTHIWYTGLIAHATKTDYSRYHIAKDHPQVVKGQAGSPYAIKDYYDIDPDLAVHPEQRMAEFEALVERTHRAGLKVIIDFVPNHVARTYHSTTCPPHVRDLGANDDTSAAFLPSNNFYYIPGTPLQLNFAPCPPGEEPYQELPAKATGNDRFDAWPTAGDWYETIKLNYGVDYATGERHFSPRPNTWEKMTEILEYWADKGVDGFRCDMAEMVPCEFWHYAIARVKSRHPQLLFIAEVYNPSEYRYYLHHGGFDYLYDKVGLYDTLRDILCHRRPASGLTGCWQQVDDIRPHLLAFLENHDEQRIASDFFLGDGARALPAIVACACMGTQPLMIYAGQELGERGMDEEGFSGRDGRTTIFDYWSIETLRALQKGEEHFTPTQRALYESYRDIVRLCNRSSALREGLFFDLMYVNYDGPHGFNPDRQYVFLRRSKDETLLILCNFSDETATVGVRIPDLAFDVLSLSEGKYQATDLLSHATTEFSLSPNRPILLPLSANAAAIWKLSEASPS
jgi:glycosidase